MLKSTTKSKTRSVYLAAPFFNDVQKAIVAETTSILEDAGFRVFSPSRDGFVVKPNATKEERQKGFDWNIAKILESDIVLAVLNYALPPNVELALITRKSEQDVTYTHVEIPDTGVAMEIGVAYKAGVPIIGYSPVAIKKLNLMLAVPLSFYVEGPIRLRLHMDSLRSNISDSDFHKELSAIGEQYNSEII